METAILLFFILVGCLTFLTGCLVRYRKKLELLPVYSAEATKDKQGLAQWAGANLMVMALLQTACGVAGLMTGYNVLLSGLAFAGMTLLTTIVLALGTAKYSKKSI